MREKKEEDLEKLRSGEMEYVDIERGDAFSEVLLNKFPVVSNDSKFFEG